MLDENVATTSLPVVAVNSSSKASMTSISGPVNPRAIDVRAVREQREHALGAELGEPVEVEVLAVDRRLIDLEVAGMDDRADRRRDGQRHTVGHAVRHADELDREWPDRHRAAAA